VGSLGSTDNVQTIFELLPCSVDHVRGNIRIQDFRSSSPLAGVGNTWLLTYPDKKKSSGVRSGERAGQSIGLSLPIHVPGNVLSRYARTCRPQ
jgi:hypothetical protein